MFSPDHNLSIAIYANGSLTSSELRRAVSYEYLIATDSACLKLLGKNIIPDLAIGDFDSVSQQDVLFLKRKIPNVKIFPVKKDLTDLELAINHAIKLKPVSIDIYGATGSRIDHTLAAIFLLEKIFSPGVQIRIINSNNEICLIEKTTELTRNTYYKYLSLLSVTENSVISLVGFRFNLKNKILRRGSTMGISNEFKSTTGKITVHKGKIILIRSRD